MATIKEIEYWFSEALNVPEENRIEYLESQLSNSPNLLEEVRTLILSEGDTESVLTQLREQLNNETNLADGGEFPIIDKYDLLEEIGRGGMAVVYRSKRTDGVFDHDVALKVLKRGMDTDDIIRRFRQERKVLARLRHPNIGQIYDGGVTLDGR
ncbi:MAG: protein kinase, partial [Bacteroidota bacterium]